MNSKASIQKLVANFHAKYEHPQGVLLSSYSAPANEVLATAAQELMTRALMLRKHGALKEDVRLQRATLMMEELAETVSALADCDIIELADGLGDLSYVTYGTGVAFGLPVDACVHEIHASNMTKEVGQFKPKKGKAYRKPDIGAVLWKAGVLAK